MQLHLIGANDAVQTSTAPFFCYKALRCARVCVIIKRMDLVEKLKNLPASSGVYLMLDEAGEIIYVGKAKSLKNRVRQYFHGGDKGPKVQAMVSHIADFRYIVTPSEVDALVLESNLIKQHQPKYNILLKDDKNYPFIKIEVKKPFPRVEIVRKLVDDGAKYFGPYMLGVSVSEIVDLIHSAYPMRTCKHDLVTKRPKRPCLNYHLGRCTAPCREGASAEEYARVVENVVRFLQGEDDIEAVLKSKMERASESEDFENAIYYRNKLKVLDKLIRNQISAVPKDFNADVFAYAYDGIFSAVSVTAVRAGRILGSDNTTVESLDMDPSSVLSSCIMQYYTERPVPQVVMTNVEADGALGDALSKVTGKKIEVRHAKRGLGARLVEMAEENAKLFIDRTVKREHEAENRKKTALTLLGEALGIPAPERMECFDISNISGTDKVASMVVFEHGDKKSAHYRRFRIKTVEGANDFACMKEVLKRRLARLVDKDESFCSRPDLIVVDGGKGQLSYAMEALAEANESLNVVGLAEENEELFLPNRSEPVVLPRDSLALYLVQRLRDEAHRFAITYHRTLRADRMTRSELKKIRGVGDVKIKNLFRQFRTMDAIKNATIDELVAVKGITESDARRIKEYFAEQA